MHVNARMHTERSMNLLVVLEVPVRHPGMEVDVVVEALPRNLEDFISAESHVVKRHRRPVVQTETRRLVWTFFIGTVYCPVLLLALDVEPVVVEYETPTEGFAYGSR